MKSIIAVLILIMFLTGCISPSNETYNPDFRIPGEFEPHQAIWLGYRSMRERGYFEEDGLKILKALNPYVKVNLVVEGEELFREGKRLFDEMGLDTTKIEIFYQEPTDAWYRDVGPIFGILRNNELAMADFRFKYEDLDHVKRDIAQRLGIKSISTQLVMDGGSFEPNGKGIVILCESITLPQNPNLTKEEIENELESKFGIRQVIWMQKGLIDDSDGPGQIYGSYYGRGTGGHTDEFVRFANDTTVLLTWVTEQEAKQHPIDSINFVRLSYNYKILDSTLNSSDKKYTIIKVPHPNPDPMELIIDSTQFSFGVPYVVFNKRLGLEHGDTVNWLGARSYMNFVMSNDVVLIPQFWEEGRSNLIKVEDSIALNTFKSVFSNRDVIGIPLDELKWVGGGMHCRYQSEPKME